MHINTQIIWGPLLFSAVLCILLVDEEREPEHGRVCRTVFRAKARSAVYQLCLHPLTSIQSHDPTWLQEELGSTVSCVLRMKNKEIWWLYSNISYGIIIILISSKFNMFRSELHPQDISRIWSCLTIAPSPPSSSSHYCLPDFCSNYLNWFPSSTLVFLKMHTSFRKQINLIMINQSPVFNTLQWTSIILRINDRCSILYLWCPLLPDSCLSRTAYILFLVLEFSSLHLCIDPSLISFKSVLSLISSKRPLIVSLKICPVLQFLNVSVFSS